MIMYREKGVITVQRRKPRIAVMQAERVSINPVCNM